MELKFQPEPMGRMTSEVNTFPKSVTPARWRVNGSLAVGQGTHSTVVKLDRIWRGYSRLLLGCHIHNRISHVSGSDLSAQTMITLCHNWGGNPCIYISAVGLIW